MNLRSTRNDFRDDGSVSVDLSSTGTNTESDPQFKPDERDETKEVQRLASSETAHIRFWRLVVVALLLVSGAVLSTFTYVFLNGEEKDDYVDAVRSIAFKRIVAAAIITLPSWTHKIVDLSLLVFLVCEHHP
jgi:hypothetical protein